MRIFILLFLITVIAFEVKSQSKKELHKQHERILDTLSKKLGGVKYADLGFSKAQEDFLINNSNSVDAAILNGIRNYLKDLGLLVIITDAQRRESLKQADSQCDYVKVDYDLGEFNSQFMAIGNYTFKFAFKFCDSSFYSFATKLRVTGITDYNKTIKSICNFEFPVKRKYNLNERLRTCS
jgi:hypothetical protein